MPKRMLKMIYFIIKNMQQKKMMWLLIKKTLSMKMMRMRKTTMTMKMSMVVVSVKKWIMTVNYYQKNKITNKRDNKNKRNDIIII
jgi:hypothetical protein